MLTDAKAAVPDAANIAIDTGAAAHGQTVLLITGRFAIRSAKSGGPCLNETVTEQEMWSRFSQPEYVESMGSAQATLDPVLSRSTTVMQAPYRADPLRTSW